MYRYGENHIRQRRRHVVVLLVGLIVLGGLIVSGVRFFHKTTTISSTQVVTAQVVAPDSKTQHINLPSFSLDLPQNWKTDTQSSGPNRYIWTNTGKDAGTRVLTLYIDTNESGLGLNRAISVQTNGGSLSTTSDVSDNCAGFTSQTAGAPSTATPAKWNGVDFLCDLGNYERNVVGTVSSDGINKTLMTGQNTGSHSIFFTYSDSGTEPDFTIFVNALQSFRLK